MAKMKIKALQRKADQMKADGKLADEKRYEEAVAFVEDEEWVKAEQAYKDATFDPEEEARKKKEAEEEEARLKAEEEAKAKAEEEERKRQEEEEKAAAEAEAAEKKKAEEEAAAAAAAKAKEEEEEAAAAAKAKEEEEEKKRQEAAAAAEAAEKQKAEEEQAAAAAKAKEEQEAAAAAAAKAKEEEERKQEEEEAAAAKAKAAEQEEAAAAAAQQQEKEKEEAERAAAAAEAEKLKAEEQKAAAEKRVEEERAAVAAAAAKAQQAEQTKRPQPEPEPEPEPEVGRGAPPPTPAQPEAALAEGSGAPHSTKEKLLSLGRSDDFDAIVAAVAEHQEQVVIGGELWEPFQALTQHKTALIRAAATELTQLCHSSDMLRMCKALSGGAGKDAANAAQRAACLERYQDLAQVAQQEIDEAHTMAGGSAKVRDVLEKYGQLTPLEGTEWIAEECEALRLVLAQDPNAQSESGALRSKLLAHLEDAACTPTKAARDLEKAALYDDLAADRQRVEHHAQANIERALGRLTSGLTLRDGGEMGRVLDECLEFAEDDRVFAAWTKLDQQRQAMASGFGAGATTTTAQRPNSGAVLVDAPVQSIAVATAEVREATAVLSSLPAAVADEVAVLADEVEETIRPEELEIEEPIEVRPGHNHHRIQTAIVVIDVARCGRIRSG